MTPDERLKLTVGDLVITRVFFEARIEQLTKENAELIARLAAAESRKAPEDDGA